MAIIGDAYVVVHAVTTGFKNDVKDSVKEMNLAKEGERAGQDFEQGLRKGAGNGGGSGNVFSSLFSDAKKLEGLQTYKAFQYMTVEAHTMGVAVSGTISSVGSLVDGAISLGSAFAAAAPTALTFLGGLSELGLGALAVKEAMKGVSQAISSGWQAAQNAANTSSLAIVQAQKALQQAELAAENQSYNAKIAAARATITYARAQVEFKLATIAAKQEVINLTLAIRGGNLDQEQAALNVVKATKTLRLLQDLPPNNAARKQAEIDLQTAKLAVDQAREHSAELKSQQDQNITGDYKGTQSYKDALQAKADAQVTYDANAKNAEYAAYQSQLAVTNAQLALDRELAGGSAMETYKQQLSQLGPAAADFVKYFVSTVMPALQAFQSAIGGPLFVGLKAGLDNLINVALPVLTPLFKTLAGAAGDAFLSISKAFTTPYNLANLKDIFGTAAYVVKQFGATAGTAMTGITTALSAASPAIKALSDFLNTKVTKFVAMLETKKATGELTTFFNTALKLFEQISGIVGNLFGGLFDVIKANTGPGSGGQMLLDFFTTISKQFKDFAGSKAGQESLRTMFADAAKNVIAMLPVIGGIFKILLDLGTNPSVAVFWTTIKQALPFVQEIFTQFTNAGPTFGQLIVQLAKFFSLLVSSGAIDLMFKVFVTTLTLINDIFSNKLVLSVFQFSHSLFAIGAAFAVMGALGGKVFGFFIGHFESISTNIGKLKQGFGILKTVAVGAIESLAEALGIAFAPAAAIVAIVVAIGVGIYELFTRNKVFHDYVMNAWNEIKIGIGVAWANIKKWFDELMGYATKLFAWMEPALQIAWTALKDLFGIIWSFIRIQLQILRGMLEVMWEVITTAFKVVIDILKGLFALFTGNWSGVAKSIGNIGKDLWAFIYKDLSIAWNVVKSIWNTITSTVAGFIHSLSGMGGGVWNWLLDGLKMVANGIIGLLNDLIHALNNVLGITVPDIWGLPNRGKRIGITIPDIPKLADGGIVSPKNGGTLALLAEAGKSERIEPLDANGLSNRDKALIARMTSGAGGGVTINVHPTPGMSSSEVAAMVSRQFAFHMRAGGR